MTRDGGVYRSTVDEKNVRMRLNGGGNRSLHFVFALRLGCAICFSHTSGLCSRRPFWFWVVPAGCLGEVIVSLGEADTRAKLIDPAIYKRGWTEDHIKREITAGAVDIIEGQGKRRSRGRVDYVLRLRLNSATQPVAVAVLEAKAEKYAATHGLEQGKSYGESKRLNVPFVFASNGHLFVEFDSTTGLTGAPKPLSEFPTPDELRSRYEAAKGFSLEDEAAKPLLAKYPLGEGTRRYYQDAAIRAVFEKLARAARTGEPRRALLSLATGAGKTFIAVNLLRRIDEAGQLRRALFLCDRDELREQGYGALHGVFGSDAAKVFKKADGTNNAANARVHVATYQTLGVADDNDDASFLMDHYPIDYFSHIVIDECHRSAWGKWSQVLLRNPNAVQIGLTATPRKLSCGENTHEARADSEITAHNVHYFGEPVYEYTLAQAIDDGYLAACEIQRGRVNIDQDGLTIDEVLKLKPKDAKTGRLLSRDELKALYENRDLDNLIQLPDRVLAMCRDLFQYLLDTGGPEQKTIVFCSRDHHADAVAATMGNLYAAWCEKNGVERRPEYAFKCTAAGGSDKLPELRGASRSHFIACTVDLLTTGVDVPKVRNIAFFRYVKSPISFYQMVGRGTRLDPASDKLMFRVYDYTNATRLFSEDFVTQPPKPKSEGGGGDGPGDGPTIITVEPGLLEVHVTPAGKYIVTNVDGKALPITVEEYKQRLAARLVAEAATLDQFRSQWIDPTQRGLLLDALPEHGRSALLVRDLEEMEPYDLFDVLGELGYGLDPKPRVLRAGSFLYKHADWLHGMPKPARQTIEAFVNQFALAGTDGLENREIFKTPAIAKAGGVVALKAVGDPFAVLQETKARVFAG